MLVTTTKLRTLGIKQIGPEAIGVTEYRLKNGLKILLAPSPTAPVVTFLAVYRVGSRNEGVGFTGATHFLEHMMFKGTPKFDPDKGLDSTELLSRVGAVANATTWFDRTNYFEAVPSQYLELCIKIEADRMRNLRLRQSDRDAEMSVVRNEMERGENSPEEALEKELYALAYREHPYHHPTIGWRSDVEGVPMARLKEFYDTYYWPNNCTIILVGDFEPEQALVMLKRYFGKIPSSPKPIPEVYTVEPEPEGEKRFEINRSGDLARVWLGFRTPGSNHPDHHAVNVIAHLLGNSMDRSSRLYKSLIDTGLAVEAFTRHDELRDPALLIIGATANPEVETKEIEAVIRQELARLCSEPVSLDELKPIKSANIKGSTLARADQMEFAFALSEAESRADWRWLADFDTKFDAVGPTEIMQAAKRYFSDRNRLVGCFLPSATEEADSSLEDNFDYQESEVAESHKPGKAAKKRKKVRATLKTLESVLKPSKSALKKRVSFASSVHKHELANGLTLLYMHSPGTGTAALSGVISAGNYFEPKDRFGLADTVAEMLNRGSEGLTKTALAEQVKELGIMDGLSFAADPFRVNFGSLVVSSDLDGYLSILARVIQEPLFLVEELEKHKQEMSSRILEERNNTGPVAAVKLHQALYPTNHPFYIKDFEARLSELSQFTQAELKKFHQQFYSPKTCILALVADLPEDKVLQLVERHFGHWQGSPGQQIVMPTLNSRAKAERIEVNLADKASMDIMLGQVLNIKRSDPDYYPLLLADLALGGDTIIARLGKVVREEHGLTYGIHSGLGENSFGQAPWLITLSVNPDNAKKALALVTQVLKEYRKSGISMDELRREAAGAAGAFIVGLRSPSAVSRVLCRFEYLGLGPEGVDAHPERIRAVKKSQVDAAIQKYLRPERLITVLAGTFNDP